MFCQLCTEQGKHGVWVDGTRNFRLKTVTDHLVSKDHLHSLSASHSGQHRVPGIQSEHTKKREAAILLALQVCYFLSLEEIPNVKSKTFLGFLLFKRLKMRYTWSEAEMPIMIPQTFSINCWHVSAGVLRRLS